MSDTRKFSVDIIVGHDVLTVLEQFGFQKGIIIAEQPFGIQRIHFVMGGGNEWAYLGRYDGNNTDGILYYTPELRPILEILVIQIEEPSFDVQGLPEWNF